MERDEMKALLEQFERAVSGKIDGAVEGLKKDVADVKEDVRKQRDMSLESHEATRKQVHLLSRHVTVLWRKVNGSDPPPPADGTTLPPLDPGGPALDDTVSRHDLEMQALHGQVIALGNHITAVKSDVSDVRGQVAEVKSTAADVKMNVADLKSEVHSVKTETKKQSKELGVDERGWGYYTRNKSGQRFVLGMIAAVTGLISTGAVIYSAYSNKAPPPALTIGVGGDVHSEGHK